MPTETLDELAERIIKVLEPRALDRELTFYDQLMKALGFKNGDKVQFARMNSGLQRLSKISHEEGGPLLSALVVTRGMGPSAGMPSAGFFTQALRLGRRVEPTKRAFWEAERDACFDWIRTHPFS